jgi:hypothetical protein
MMGKGLAWREGAEEGLAVEVTCGRLSYRYTGCQALFWRRCKELRNLRLRGCGVQRRNGYACLGQQGGNQVGAEERHQGRTAGTGRGKVKTSSLMAKAAPPAGTSRLLRQFGTSSTPKFQGR